MTGAAAPSRPRLSNTMNNPTSVILQVEAVEGLMAEMELVFPTRWKAEWFVAQLPLLMIEQVKSAIISPLEIV